MTVKNCPQRMQSTATHAGGRGRRIRTYCYCAWRAWLVPSGHRNLTACQSSGLLLFLLLPKARCRACLCCPIRPEMLLSRYWFRRKGWENFSLNPCPSSGEKSRIPSYSYRALLPHLLSYFLSCYPSLKNLPPFILANFVFLLIPCFCFVN